MRYKFADGIVLTCKSIYDNNFKVFRKIKNKVFIIYGSVDEKHFKVKRTKFKTAEKYKINLKNKIVGIVGRTDIVKDQYTFLKAAKIVNEKVRNVFFIIAGKEEKIKFFEIKKIAKEYKLENKLLILPKISDIQNVINLFDIGIITSIESETISRVLFEYMYLKKPVIGTNINAIGEIIENGKNGFIIKPYEYKKLARYIIKLLNDSGLREKMGETSYRIYQEKYSEKVFYQKYLKVFNKVF